MLELMEKWTFSIKKFQASSGVAVENVRHALDTKDIED